MKCYRLLLILLLTLPLVSSADNILIPYKQIKIKTTDILWVEINTSLNDDEIKKREKTKLTSIVYVLDYKEESGKKLFKIIILPEEKKKTKGENENKYDFRMEGFDYKALPSNPLEKFITLTDKKNIGMDNSKLLLFFLGGVFCFMFIIYLYKKKLKAKLNKRNKAKRTKKHYIQLIESANVRIDLENLYCKRKEIEENINIKDEILKEYISEIDLIQYKEIWSDQDLIKIMDIKNKLLDKSGGFDGV